MKITAIRSTELPKGTHHVALVSLSVARRDKWSHRLEALPRSYVQTASAGCSHFHRAILSSDAVLIGVPVIARASLTIR